MRQCFTLIYGFLILKNIYKTTKSRKKFLNLTRVRRTVNRFLKFEFFISGDSKKISKIWIFINFLDFQEKRIQSLKVRRRLRCAFDLTTKFQSMLLLQTTLNHSSFYILSEWILNLSSSTKKALCSCVFNYSKRCQHFCSNVDKTLLPWPNFILHFACNVSPSLLTTHPLTILQVETNPLILKCLQRRMSFFASYRDRGLTLMWCYCC